MSKLDHRAVEDFLAAGAMERGHALRTQSIQRRLLERLALWLDRKRNGKDWPAVQPDDLREFLSYRRQSGRVGPTTLRLETSILRTFGAHLQRMGRTQKSMSVGLRSPKLSRKLPPSLRIKFVESSNPHPPKLPSVCETVPFSNFFTPPASALPKSSPFESNNSTYRGVVLVSSEKETRSDSFFWAKPPKKPSSGIFTPPDPNSSAQNRVERSFWGIMVVA